MWKIKSISNATHAITLQHADGDLHDFVIPIEHQISDEARKLYVESILKAKALEKEVQAKALAEKQIVEENVKTMGPFVIALIVLSLITIALFLRYK